MMDVFCDGQERRERMYTFESRIRYSETNQSGQLAIAHLVDYFQDCSVFQSEELGLGVEYLASKKRAWMLNAWQIVIERLPQEGESVTVGTWASGFQRFHGTRNFIMDAEDGERLAYANSIWVYLDTSSGRPSKPGEEEILRYHQEEPLLMEYRPRKIRLPKIWEEREPIRVKKGWIDSNTHVNNSQYVKAALDELPDGIEIGQLRVEYQCQAKEGEVLYPRAAREEGRRVIALCSKEKKPYAIVEIEEKNR